MFSHLQRSGKLGSMCITSVSDGDIICYPMQLCYYVTHPPETECQPLCLPSSSNVITKQLRSGPKSYKIIKDCRFVDATCNHCKRRSYKVKYFEFSKYETEVDVGRCTGQCDDSEG